MHSFLQSPAGPLGSPSAAADATTSPSSPRCHGDTELALALGRIPSPTQLGAATPSTPPLLKPTLTLSPPSTAFLSAASCTIATPASGFFKLPPAIQSHILSHSSIPHLTTQVLHVSRAMRQAVHHYLGRWLLADAHMQGSLIVSALGSGHAATAPPVGTIAFRASAVCPERSLVTFSATRLPVAGAPTASTTPAAQCLETHVASIVVDPAETSVWWSLKLDLAPVTPSVPAAVVDRYKLVDYSQTGPYSDSPIDMHNGAYMIQTPRMVHVPGRGAFSVTVRESPTPDASRLLHIDLSPVVMPLMHVVHMFARNAPSTRSLVDAPVELVHATQPTRRSSFASHSEWMVRQADTVSRATAEFVGKHTDALDRVLCSPAATRYGQSLALGMTSPLLGATSLDTPPLPPLWRPFAPSAVPANVTPPIPSSPLSLTASPAWPSSALALSASYQMTTLAPPTGMHSTLALSCGMSPPMSSATPGASTTAPAHGSRAWAMSALRGWHKLSISDSQRLHSASHL